MNYNVATSFLVPGEWRVERIDPVDSGVEVTLFSGPNAERRAKDYAAFMERAAFHKV